MTSSAGAGPLSVRAFWSSSYDLMARMFYGGRLFRVLQIFSGLEVLPGGIEVRACRPNPTPHPDPDPAGVFVEAIDPGGEKNVENSGRLGTPYLTAPTSTISYRF